MEDRQPQQAGGRAPKSSGHERVVPVRELVGSDGSVELEHRGEIYRLRITRNGKLILTK